MATVCGSNSSNVAFFLSRAFGFSHFFAWQCNTKQRIGYQTYNQRFNLMSLQDQNRKLVKFAALFEYLDKSDDRNDPMYHHIRNTYYYFDMRIKHMMYYNGTQKRKEKKHVEFNR